MTHKRSKEKEQVRRIHKTILHNSFHDKRRSETICKISRTDILALLQEPIEVHLVPDVEKGEVLADSRGRGSFQGETPRIMKPW